MHEWSSRPRRSRLVGLLRPWAATSRPVPPPAPAANSAPAPAHSDPLSAIPILSLPCDSTSSSPPVSFINPLTSQPLQLHCLPAGVGNDADADAQSGAWLAQLADPLPRTTSTASLLSGMSACSSSSSKGGVGTGQGNASGCANGVHTGCARPPSAGSFVCPPCPAAVALPSSSGSSASSSQSNLLNLWMQQAEPGVPTSGPTLQAAPRMAAPEAAERSTAADMQLSPALGPGATTNPLLQQLAEPQAALLSWRRHAHCPLGGERREPELLRRLLSGQGEDAAAAAEPPLSPSGLQPAGNARGRASGRHLLLLTATLALMVLLLHGLHSHELEQQLAQEQQEQQQMLLYQTAVLEAAEDAGAAAAGLEDATGAVLGQQPLAVLAPAHGTRTAGSTLPGRKFGHHHFSVQQAAQQARLPRLHLRRRLTLLLFRQVWPLGGASGGAGNVHSGGASNVEEFIFEEWEVDSGRD